MPSLSRLLIHSLKRCICKMIDITKASGEKESYRREKFCTSLAKSGVPPEVIDKVCQKVEEKIKPGFSTEHIHGIAEKYLSRENPLFLARYNLKRAIMELGPAGFLFERYVAALLKEYGYRVEVDQILQGMCVSHEIDIVAEKENRHFFIEAKYHNSRGVKSDITVAMYSWARFLDIKEASEKTEKTQSVHEAWIVTNTKFTTKAIAFAECRGVRMTGWHYPGQESLEALIERKSLYPATILPSLSRFAREQLVKAGILFAKEIASFDPFQLAKKIDIPLALAKSIAYEASLLGKEKTY